MSSSSPCDRRRVVLTLSKGAVVPATQVSNRADQLSRLWEPAAVRRTESSCIRHGPTRHSSGGEEARSGNVAEVESATRLAKVTTMLERVSATMFTKRRVADPTGSRALLRMPRGQP